LDRRRLARLGVVAAARLGVVAAAGALLCGCTSSAEKPTTPGLEPRGTVLTTVKPTRQDLTNQISLNGKVEIDPVFGIVAPVSGEIRYVNRQPSVKPADEPLWVGSVWRDGAPNRVYIPTGSTFAGRLMADHADVTAGMPVASAKHAGYGIVAEIDSSQAYRISGSVQTVRGQIKNGPGPFPCKTLGTIAALPAGTVPEPPPTTNPSAPPAGGPPQAVTGDQSTDGSTGGSDPTGMRLVCTPPASVKLINGAAVTLDVVTAKAAHVLVLPVEAVAGVQGKGKVDIVGPDRTRKTVDVTLGITDGKVIEIRKGLTGDETIAVPGPDLPTAVPNTDQGGSGAPG
jgi:hypothetical protein